MRRPRTSLIVGQCQQASQPSLMTGGCLAEPDPFVSTSHHRISRFSVQIVDRFNLKGFILFVRFFSVVCRLRE